MKQPPAYVVGVVLVLLAMFLGGLLYQKSKECRQQATRIDVLYSQARDWQGKALRGQSQLESLNIRLRGFTAPNIDDPEMRDLQRQGLANPRADLVADLQLHPELIPYAGTEGSRMGWYSTDRIRVLGGRWVYAEFEDGHIAGEAILEYHVGAKGKITWKIVRSRLL